MACFSNHEDVYILSKNPNDGRLKYRPPKLLHRLQLDRISTSSHEYHNITILLVSLPKTQLQAT